MTSFDDLKFDVRGDGCSPSISTRIAAILVVVLLLGLTQPGATKQLGLGIGLIVGEPTGISIKKWTGRTTAYDAAAAWSFLERSTLQFHGDYLLHAHKILPEISPAFTFYYGFGARILLHTETDEKKDGRTGMGIRFPVGLTVMPGRVMIDPFLEIVPIFRVIPNSTLDLNGAVGLRYYF